MKKIHIRILAALIAAFALTAPAHAQTSLQRMKALQLDSAISISISADSLTHAIVYTQAHNDNEDSTSHVAPLMQQISSQPLHKTIMKTIIGALTIISPFAFILLLMLIIFRFKAQRIREQNRLIEISLHEHVPLPDAFFQNNQQPNSPTKKLSSGIIWSGCGIAFFLFFIIAGSPEMAVLGLIPLFVGISRIAVYLINQKSADKD